MYLLILTHILLRLQPGNSCFEDGHINNGNSSGRNIYLQFTQYLIWYYVVIQAYFQTAFVCINVLYFPSQNLYVMFQFFK